MAGTDFIDAFRSTFMGQRNQVQAEKAAEKAAEKTKQAQANAFLNALRNAVEKEESGKTPATDTPGVNGIIDKEKNPEIPENIKKIEPLKATDNSGTYSEDDYVTYTYRPGDNFGQVIKNLGLNTDAGLWGEDGDVEFYTEQLYEQGALDEQGNIPIGTTIKLRKRWAIPKNIQLS